MTLSFGGRCTSSSTGISTNLPGAEERFILGPILFLLVFNVPHSGALVFTRWGYVRTGTGVLRIEGGMMESLTWGVDYRSDGSRGDDRFNDRYTTFPLSFGAGRPKPGTRTLSTTSALHAAVGEFWHRLLATGTGEDIKPLSIIGGMALVGILGSWIGLF